MALARFDRADITATRLSRFPQPRFPCAALERGEDELSGSATESVAKHYAVNYSRNLLAARRAGAL